MTILYLVRHGQSTWNAAGRWQGQANPPLNAVGRAQAQALARRLQYDHVQAIYSSPLARARETAEILGAAVRLPVTFERQLIERDVGLWSGLNGELVRQHWPEYFTRGWHIAGAPGGEQQAELNARAAAVFGRIVAAHPTENVVVVSHGGTLLAYFFHLLQLPLESAVTFRFGNTALAKVQVTPEHVRVLTVGDEQHLVGLM